MPDCPNADVRDLLPGHALGVLGAEERAHVDAHLAGCEACREELGLLRAVRALRPAAPIPDVSRIVAALPRPAVFPTDRSPRVVAIDAARPRARRALPWRAVAGVAAVLVGAVGVGLYGRRSTDTPSVTATAVEPAVVAESLAPSAPPALADTPRVAKAPAAGTQAPPDALGSLGGITSDATERELRTLIESLESLSGLPDVEATEGDTWAGAEDTR